MSILMVNESVDFNSLKDLLDVTDGNLASHLSALEKNGLIEVQKKFIGRKPNTTYRITYSGRNAFSDHLGYLEMIVNSNSNAINNSGKTNVTRHKSNLKNSNHGHD